MPEVIKLEIIPDTKAFKKAMEQLQADYGKASTAKGTFGAAVAGAPPGTLPGEGISGLKDILTEIRDLLKRSSDEGRRAGGGESGGGGGLGGLLGGLGGGVGGLLRFAGKGLLGAGVGLGAGFGASALLGAAGVGDEGTGGILKRIGSAAAGGAAGGGMSFGPWGALIGGAGAAGVAGINELLKDKGGIMGATKNLGGMWGSGFLGEAEAGGPGFVGTAMGAWGAMRGFQHGGLGGGLMGMYGAQAGYARGGVLGGAVGGMLMPQIAHQAVEAYPEALEFQAEQAQARMLLGGRVLHHGKGAVGEAAHVAGYTKRELAGLVPQMHSAGFGRVMSDEMMGTMMMMGKARGIDPSQMMGAMGGIFSKMGPMGQGQAQEKALESIMARGVEAGFERQLPHFTTAVASGVQSGTSGLLLASEETAEATSDYAEAIASVSKRYGTGAEQASQFVGAIGGGFMAGGRGLMAGQGGLMGALGLGLFSEQGAKLAAEQGMTGPGSEIFGASQMMMQAGRNPGGPEAVAMMRSMLPHMKGGMGGMLLQQMFPQIQDPKAIMKTVGSLGKLGEGATDEQIRDAMLGLRDETKSEKEILTDFQHTMHEDLEKWGGPLRAMANYQDKQLSISLSLQSLGAAQVQLQMESTRLLAQFAGKEVGPQVEAVLQDLKSGIRDLAGSKDVTGDSMKLMERIFGRVIGDFEIPGVGKVGGGAGLPSGEKPFNYGETTTEKIVRMKKEGKKVDFTPMGKPTTVIPKVPRRGR